MADPQTIIGRLNKRIAKLQQQRDFFRQRCDYYAEVIRLHPYMERDYKSVMERRKERERVQGLEQRVREQALLIEKLTAAAGVPVVEAPSGGVIWTPEDEARLDAAIAKRAAARVARGVLGMDGGQR